MPRRLTYAQVQALTFIGCCFAAGALLGLTIGVVREWRAR